MKKDIGTLMYNDIIIKNFTEPHNVGDLESADYEIEIGNPVCGDRIKVQLLVTDKVINKAVFRAWGCATSVATANIFCSSIAGEAYDNISQRQPLEIGQMLGELEPSQQHCVEILVELHQKLADTISSGVV
ncbi:iron-sulfur cluster assembly scaffold protein [Rheinheimera sp. MMS21-TC3]|uniref:iron-sulfur cluster assembly scaffold protein n=1 Tax=Rheinheimera sp. MMS21-TC3 TaxID=3072790 RepID=UPI0028C3FA43|nr:iron-sulfur cluster assembly scaffold protein [Rheinheimera sp. MMS21-TC3]WNO60624.1 iron-sulfur cluster assembly scaffold protein [Rheinheimera sp. MMS21-TC3]